MNLFILNPIIGIIIIRAAGIYISTLLLISTGEKRIDRFR